jgi:hypothetical protein
VDCVVFMACGQSADIKATNGSLEAAGEWRLIV